jgi:outer membrane protein assembly factor BamB
VVHGDAMFLWSDGGVVTCIDPASGQVHWAGRVLQDGSFSGSPIRAGDKIYCISDDGTVVSIAADKKQLRVLGKTSLDEGSRATPAVSGGQMYLRTFSHLICVGAQAT